MNELGQNIMRLRKEQGMTQEELAAKLGYKSKSTINKIELGINDIPQSKVVKFAEVLQTSIADLMGWNEEIEKNPVGMAEKHFEMISDVDLQEIFEDFKVLDARERRIVKDLIRNLAKIKTEA
jgi:transcriptional regulator with XRE-family HTH domain